MLTTIVIPVWDAYAALLPAAVQSIKAQEATDAKLIIVDNASTTALPRLPQTEVVTIPQRVSVGSARNIGLASVNTPFVMFWDADDIMLPGTLAYLEVMLEEDRGADVALCSRTAWNHETGIRCPWGGWPRPWAYRLAAHRRRFLLRSALTVPFPTTGPTLIRTEAVHRTSGFADLNLGEDWALSVQLILGGRVSITRRSGRLYRVHAGSLYNTQFDRGNFRSAARVVRHELARRKCTPLTVRALLPLIASYHVVWAWLYADNVPFDWTSMQLGSLPLLPDTRPPVRTRSSGWYARAVLRSLKRLLITLGRTLRQVPVRTSDRSAEPPRPALQAADLLIQSAEAAEFGQAGLSDARNHPGSR